MPYEELCTQSEGTYGISSNSSSAILSASEINVDE